MMIPLDPKRDIFINYIDQSYTGSGYKLIDSAPKEAIESLRLYEENFKKEHEAMSMIER